ncbi:LytTR family DNA-binding domain-containing protein [Parabacteroides sp. PF5-6]|uniref:LytR/AlgR family response regulator transcription factor n=1 Tax=Parabacteroides sp. PF5-6 TaxID=1742403 RepID=UPI002407157E|nr:LytTR family DNA-binding domain-containing protein [Parabacteroides sp. PF5-6]MDF9831151.1 DNA-binding LytR/AlgR family response regulator [Parabacteroides sp. PF5-6]
MKVLIIEDERPAAQKIIRLLEEIDKGIEVVDVLKSVEQATNWFTTHPAPELIFMDIQLEDGISFELFETCEIKAPIIFTTAYDEYTLKAFKVNSVDYLLKPIASDDLKKAIHKFNTYHRQKMDYTQLEHIIRQLQPATKERFLIKVGEHYRSIPTSSIHRFYILERNTFVETDKGKNYPIDYSLDKIEQMVDPKLFFRVNRNFIVNFYAIRDIIIYSSNRLKLKLDNWVEEDILVSRERVTAFKEWMDR